MALAKPFFLRSVCFSMSCAPRRRDATRKKGKKSTGNPVFFPQVLLLFFLPCVPSNQVTPPPQSRVPNRTRTVQCTTGLLLFFCFPAALFPEAKVVGSSFRFLVAKANVCVSRVQKLLRYNPLWVWRVGLSSFFCYLLLFVI